MAVVSGKSGWWVLTGKGHDECSGVDGDLYTVRGVWVTQLFVFVKPTGILRLRLVHFIVGQ